ncbi:MULTISPECIES: four helix bundle protein [unclassified Spirosoma]|uniref:four helix bundle protein n=1 Tax=unclassified Spirosoma TaxID=2621999 RepID=UPI000A91AF39|nr:MULTISPECIES: four helix bundle protein [unclassified Spirosoma]MBN8821860.1 four helix bundle protein [Spirosoma sp.]
MSERTIYDSKNLQEQENLVQEAWVDYSGQSKSQFLDDLEKRLKLFMLRCVKVYRTLSKDYDVQHFGHQLIRSSSSAAANFRAVRRGRSQKEYFAKLSVTIEELDESLFWLETLIYTELVPEHRLADLIDEGYQILKILSKSRKSVSD